MTIKGLMKYLKDAGYKPIVHKLSSMQGKSLAIDANLLISRYYSVQKKTFLYNSDLSDGLPNDEGVIPYVLEKIDCFIRVLLDHDVRPIMCFDGKKNALKEKVWQERDKQGERTHVTLARAANALQMAGVFRQRSSIIEAYVKAYVNHYNREVVKKIVTATKLFCEEELKVVCLVAGEGVFSEVNPEAEALCAALCNNNLCYAAYSSDSDLLPYGVRFTIRDISNVDTEDGKVVMCEVVSLKNVLRVLQLTERQLIEFCVLCGTDYNKNIYRVGPVRAIDYIRKYKTIDNIKEETSLDISVLNHEEVLPLFYSSRVHLDYVLPEVKPNVDKDSIAYMEAVAQV